MTRAVRAPRAPTRRIRARSIRAPRTRRLLAALLPAALLAAAGRAAAQAPAPAGPTADPAMAATRPHYERVKGYLLRAAAEAPDSDYAFRPTATVRTFGEMVAHVAAAQYYFCSAALGERNPAPADLEKTRTGKTAALESLRGAFALCDRAYALPDAAALRPVAPPGGRPSAPLSLLVLNVGHDNEHYGNLVTYLRLRGRVPPSSQPGS